MIAHLRLLNKSNLVCTAAEWRFKFSCVPPTIAKSHALCMRYLYAQSKAYAELEQPVSIVNEGPHSPRV